MTDYASVIDKLYPQPPADSPLATQPAGAPAAEPPGSAGTRRSPYADIVDRMVEDRNARLRTSVFGAGLANPDAAARARKIAERTGMAPDAVERNLPTAERQVLVEDVDRYTADTPALRAAYGDPYFAKAGKDDLFTLTAIEKAVRRVLDPNADDRKQTREAIGAVGEFLAEGAKQIGMGATVGLGAGIADVAGFGVDVAAGATGSATLERQAATYRQIAERARESMDYFSVKPEGNIAAGLQSGFRSSGQNLALLPLGVAAGAEAMLAGMVGMVGAGAFNKARSKGKNRVDAAIYAAPEAVFEYAFEKIPASRLLADIAKNSTVFTMVKNQLLPEVLGEQATTVLQDLNEWVRLNPDKSAKEFIAERPDAAIQTLVATLVGVGVQTGTVRGIQKVLGGAAELEARARDAEVRANNLGELFEIAAGSKLRGRDATTFGAFVQQAAEATGSELADVTVDATKLAEVLNQTRTSREAFAAMSPKAAEALDDALQSGGSVSIPIGDLVGRMGDTGIEQALLPHLRVGEDGLSQEEAVAEQAAAQQLLQQESDRILAQAQDAQVAEESVERVRTTLMAQLQAAGRFSVDVNRAYSTLAGSFYTVLGQRLGVTPEQAYARFPLRVQGVGQAGEALTQASDAEKAEVLRGVIQDSTLDELRKALVNFAELPTAPLAAQDLERAKALLAPAMEKAVAAKPAFDATVQRIADKIGIQARIPGIKKMPRSAAKLATELDFDVARMRDLVRATVVVDSVADIQAAIDEIRANFQIVRIKNRFDAPTEAGYRDVLVNVRLDSGIDAEIQVNIPSMILAKSHGHKLYAMTRAMEPGELKSGLENLQSRVYGEAFSAAQNAMSAASAREALLRKTSGGKGLPDSANTTVPSASLSTGTPSTSNTVAPSGTLNIEPSFDAPILPDATLDDFTRENLPGLLSKDNWVVLTAADPGATKQSDEQNEAANARLRQDLDDIGLTYTEAIGRYGEVAPSFIVIGVPESVATALGTKYGQESVLTRKGLIYQDGSITPAVGVDVFETAPEDFYTEVPGTGAFFSVQLDFDQRVQPDGVFNQSGRAEGDTRYQNRAIELLAGLSIPKRSGARIMSGAESAPLLKTNVEIARYFTSKYPSIEDTSTPAAQKAIVDALYADALQALTDKGSAVGWYDRKVKAALDLVAELHPEISTNEEARFGFIVMLAITSNRTRVNENMELAERLYRAWKETGAWPSEALIPQSQARAEIVASMAQMQRIISKHGWQAARDFMLGNHPVADIEAFAGSKVGGELAGSELYGAVFLGSKIGAFFNNLYGNYGPVTMDRWFVRSVSRVRGRMLVLPPSFETNLDKLVAQIAEGVDTFGVKPQAILADIAKYKAWPESRKGNAVTAARAMPSVSRYAAERFKVFAKGITLPDGTKKTYADRSRFNVLAKTLYESLNADEIVPNGGRERADFRAIAVKLQERLRADGLDIVMADLQAILWYFEKDLFAKLKGETRQGDLALGATASAEAEDYETAARRLLRHVRGEGAGRTGPARPGERPPAGQRVAETRIDTTADLFAQSPVDDAATQVEQRRMRQAVDLALLQVKPAGGGTLKQSAPGAKPGELTITGVHFSTRQGLNYLNGQFYGTGLKGAERDRVRNSPDTRLASRTYFYIDEGKGVRPEAGVGGNAHQATLANVYDINADPLKLVAGGDINATETNILNAGFDGYYVRDAFNQQGAAVIIGPASHAIPVTPIANPTTKAPPLPPTAPPVYKRGLLSREVQALDIKAVQAVAPSARVRSGNFEVLQSEFAAAAGVAALQGVNLPAAYGQGSGIRGTFQPSSLTISLLENADLSTFLHETGHFMLEVLANVSSSADAPVEVRQDMDTVLRWFGVPSLEQWNRLSLAEKTPYHEKFAEGFEAYLFEGKAPSRELQPLFQRFAAWFKNIYRSLADFMAGNNTQLSEEVRAVFDRMLATEEQIRAKEEEYLFSQMFTSKPDTMTDDEFAEYMLANQTATGEAMDELQARSLRDLRWVLNARSRELVKLRKGVAEKRAEVEAEVRAEVQAQPVYLVQRWLKTGVNADGEQNVGAKLNTADLRDIFGDGPAAPWRYLATNMLSNERETSLHPDVVAQMFGFTSGEAMVRDIVAAFPFEQTVQGLTDTRMLERYGDIASQRALDDAANAAVHNEYRARALATELKALTQATQPVRVLVAAAKSFAAQLVGRKRLKDVKPGEFAAAEKRAAKRAAQASAAEGGTQDAVVAKRDQVLQFHAAQEARKALEDARKARELFKKVITGKDDDVGKTRDMALVNAARAILANYGFGAKAKSAHEYLMLLQDHDPAAYEAVVDRVLAAEQAGKPFDELTVDEMRALVDEVASLWSLARRTRQVEIDGKLIELDTAREAIAQRLDEIGVPDRIPGEGSAVTPAEKRLSMLQSFVAAARRVEQWIGAKDGADTGAFRKYIFNPIKDAADLYRRDRNAYIHRYEKLLKTIAPTLKRGLIEAPELGYTFGKDSGGVAMGEVLHALLHTGNPSNKRKLLLGRKWATELPDGTLDTSAWDAFVQRMIDEGRLTKAHYDFAQGVWDLLESTKPAAQKMHRAVFGRQFNEVSAEGFTTPFGGYRGGYIPAMADPRVVFDAKTRALAEEENQSMAFAFPATNKGFTKSRVEYNRPLMLDLRTLAGHLDKVLLFSHMEGPVRDVRRILTGKGVAQNLSRIDPAAFDSLLTPWLNRAAKQLVETPIAGSNGMMRFFSGARANAGMAAMFANVSNTAQQITGLSIAAVRVPPRHLRSAIAAYIAHPKQVAQDVASISPFMDARMKNEVAAIQDSIADILLDPSVYDKAKAWTRKHAYFMQQAVDNVIGPVVWLGAHNDALERGMSELDARRHADSVVRTTQGSTLPEDVSRIETGNSFVRLFTQFMGYFNMQANTVGTELKKTMDSVGLRKGAGRAMYVLMFGALAPAWIAEAIAQAFKGGPGDEDDDGWYLDDWLMAVFGIGTLRTATAAVPVAGQIVNAGANVLNNKPYDDRIGNSPAISMIESTVRAPVSVYKAIVDDGSAQKAVRDVATAISMITGLPAAPIARPFGYLAGMADEKIEPTGPFDAARGLVTGTASPDSRQ